MILNCNNVIDVAKSNALIVPTGGGNLFEGRHSGCYMRFYYALNCWKKSVAVSNGYAVWAQPQVYVENVPWE